MIHQNSYNRKNTEIGENVEIGPYTVIGDNVRIGKNTKIGPAGCYRGAHDNRRRLPHISVLLSGCHPHRTLKVSRRRHRAYYRQ